MFSVICSLKLLHFIHVMCHDIINYVLFFFHFFKGMRWQCTMNMLSLYFPTSGKESLHDWFLGCVQNVGWGVGEVQ